MVVTQGKVSGSEGLRGIQRPPASLPQATDPRPQREQPADEQTERHRRLFEQLHDDAGLSTFGLPVCRLQRPVVVLVQEEEGLAVGHRVEHLEREWKDKQQRARPCYVSTASCNQQWRWVTAPPPTCLSSEGGSVSESGASGGWSCDSITFLCS